MFAYHGGLHSSPHHTWTHLLSQDLRGAARNLRPAWTLFLPQEMGKCRKAGNMTLTLRKENQSGHGERVSQMERRVLTELTTQAAVRIGTVKRGTMSGVRASPMTVLESKERPLRSWGRCLNLQRGAGGMREQKVKATSW